MSDLLQKLNDMQLLAVKHTEGAVLVVAGAGSGKTRVLTHRIAYILEQKLATPREIMAITFTNKATQEMQSRLMNMVGNIDGMWVSTIHGMCARILRRYVSYLSGFQPGFTIYSETEKERVLKRILPDIVGDDVSKYLREVKFEISNAKNHAISPEEYPKNAISDSQTLTAKVYPLYQAELLRCNAMDFDDLLTLTLKLLSESKEVLQELQQRFRYIHVDEFQDTNRVQYDIVRLLAGGHGNIFAVGDDDQSIYAFRGAVVEHMYSFQKDFPDVTVYKLEQNYRSSQFILDAANNLIADNRTRMSKKLWTNNGKGSVIVCKSLSGESAEATFVIGQIRSMVDRGGYDYSDFAILMRMNAMTRAFEQEAMGYGVPYKVYGGFKFYERKEIKDAVAYLQLIVNPFDEEALRRIINVPKRGIGDVALKTLKEYADASHLSLFDMILQADALPGAYAKKFMPFARLMKDLIYESALVQPAEFIKSVIKKVGLDKMYDKTTEEGAEKLANLDEFISSAEEFFKANPNEPLSGYLESVSLMSDV
ncbi:MAG: UvrD-helicase domain-containing protein, partial [Clostridia bacterium]|nr:UvrD-helicase domain-containing protein [Clostridia bacterium]